MPSVDEKVVKVSLDESSLDKNSKKAINDLDALKKALEFKDAERGLEAVTKAAAQVDMNPLSNGIADVTNKFNILNTVGVAALFNITNKAIDAGERLIKSLSIDQVNAGWDKFADKTSAVQTIMASTSNQFTDTGKQMEYVENQLEKLNWFTDETSYRFLDMVNNIGKFTASNIALDKSVDAMQGIAAWAARSGAGVQGASRAMYNLSQSMAMGAVRLQDWMSIENANMATYEFKNTALETAAELGKLTKVAEGYFTTLSGETEITARNFRETLQKEWLDSDVLIKTLEKYGSFATELNKWYDDLKGAIPTTTLIGFIDDYIDGSLDMNHVMNLTGLTAEQLESTLSRLGSEQYKLGRESFKAAQETKTFGEAIDYVREAVSSGWMRTFEYLFGNYEEAKEFFSGMSEWLYDIFVASGDARNALLSLWKDQGGRDIFIEGLEKIMENISTLLETIKDAWHDVFPETTVDDLMDLTDGFRNLVDVLTPTEESLENIGNVVRAVATAIQTLKNVVGTFVTGMSPIFRVLNRFAGIVANTIGLIAKFSIRLMNILFPNDQLDEFGNKIENTSDMIANVLNRGLDALVYVLASVFHAVDVLFTYIEQNGGGVQAVFKGLYYAAQDLLGNLFNMETISGLFDGAFGGLKTLFTGLLTAVSEFVSELTGIDLGGAEGIEGWIEGVSTALDNADISGKLSAIVVAIGDIVGALLQFVGDLIGVNTDIKGVVNDIVTGVTSLFNWIVDQLSHLTFEDIKNVALVIFLGELVFSLKKLFTSLTKGVGGITKVFTELGNLLGKFSGKSSFASQLESMFAKTKWLQITAAIAVLVTGLLQLSRVPADQLYQGVIAIVAVLGMVSVALMLINKMVKGKGGAGGGSGGSDAIDKFTQMMVSLGLGLGALSLAVSQMAKANPTQLIAAVIALGAIMTELYIFARGIQQIDTSDLTKAAGSMALLSLSITAMIPAVAILGLLDPVQLTKGVLAVGGLMVGFGLFAKLVGKTDWKPLLAIVPVMLSFTASLMALSGVVSLLSLMKPDQLAQGLNTVATMIIALGVAISVMTAAASIANGSTLSALSLEIISFAAAITILASAVKSMGEMNPDQFKQGMIAIGAGIGAIVLVLGGLIAAAALLPATTPVLQAFAAVLIGFAASVAAVGLAAAGIGVAVKLIADGFSTLVELSAKFGDELPYHVLNAAGALTLAFAEILGAIYALQHPLFLATLATFSVILKALVVLIPDIVDGVMVLLTETFNAIANMAPYLMQALTKLVQGVADNIGPLFNAIDNLLREIFVHIGITLHNLIMDIPSFIMGLISGEDYSGAISRVFIDEMGQAYIDGVPASMEEAQAVIKEELEKNGEETAKTVTDSSKKTFEEEGPKVAETAGNSVLSGLGKLIPGFNTMGGDLGSAVLGGLQNTLEGYGLEIDSLGLFGTAKKADDKYARQRSKEGNLLGISEDTKKKTKKEYEDVGVNNADAYVNALGSGIASSSKPSAGARAQAQKVNDAFTDELDQLSIADKTGEALLKLWKAQNPNASEADIAIKEMELQAEKIETQSARAQISQMQYTETVKAMGENAAETHEAYIKMIEDQTKLLELQNELSKMQVQGSTDSSEAFQKMNDILHNYYYSTDGGRTTAEFLKSLGFTDREIAESAAKEAGYAIPKIVETTKDATVAATQAAGEQTVQLYAQSVTTNLEAMRPKFTDMGNAYATDLGTGMVEKTENVGEAAKKTVDGAREEAGSSEMIQKWNDLGYQIDMGIISGIERGSGEVAAAVRKMIQAALAAAQSAAKVRSPSRETAWQASMWIAGYVNELNQNGSKIGDALGRQVSTAFKTISSNTNALLTATKEDIDRFAAVNPIEAAFRDMPDIDDTVHIQVVMDLDDSALQSIPNQMYQTATPNASQTLSTPWLSNVSRSLQDNNLRLSAIETRMNRENSSGGVSGSGVGSTPTVINNNFTQNNTSPKALSRVEIYRDTQRMFNSFSNRLSQTNHKLR